MVRTWEESAEGSGGRGSRPVLALPAARQGGQEAAEKPPCARLSNAHAAPATRTSQL